MKTKYVFVIQAYESQEDDGRLSDVVSLELYGKTYKEALKKAQEIIKKKFYRLSSVIETKK